MLPLIEASVEKSDSSPAALGTVIFAPHRLENVLQIRRSESMIYLSKGRDLNFSSRPHYDRSKFTGPLSTE
ncbi:hypothetical protein BO99DRAFT_232502 [Aspergillus violaceofuscus CBS 115571]|uniref:Uncharacterized protein n=1 Tax=Aspergillus violaceofuscus (strain CBS 115571) TaxID=1450538 RepID=A0A2V5GYA5_ASPV1|nr:hypothetical protein BO99DRAFT_232502 [Aspergillus violaceofuscus CBS 115571]